MAGNKNSGRRSRYQELRVNILGDLSINWAIDNWDKLKKSERLKILLVLAPKYIKQEHQHGGEINFNLKSLINYVARTDINRAKASEESTADMARFSDT